YFNFHIHLLRNHRRPKKSPIFSVRCINFQSLRCINLLPLLTSQTPHCKPRVIYDFFGIAESTGQSKSREIREALGMGSFSPDWTLPSRLTKNPLMWMLKVNGLLVDIRRAPLGLQRMAFEKGLIPFIPAEQPEQEG
ncbi:DUF6398 domain-containing protein, partial [Accumulibacter sp.]